jgi:acetate kinase
MSHSLLAMNRGSSSVKFALFTFGAEPAPLTRGTIEVSDHHVMARRVLDQIEPDLRETSLAAIGHRVVHGGPLYRDPQPITAPFLGQLRRLVPFAPNHLPDEIALIEAFGQLRPDVPQIACFDTAFHHDLPEVARRLPIPRSYDAIGIRRYGFHGLSYAFLMQELARIAGPQAAASKVVLAHLGNGSSLAAVVGGRCMDTSMGFTPIGGVAMSTRSGDLDPGVVTYIARTEGLTPDQLEDVASHRSGLLGISGVTGDMRTLLAAGPTNEASGLAVSMYCYEIKKRIGSYAAALGGLETLVFAGGIGEHAPPVRAQICQGLAFLGMDLDHERNAGNAAVISTPASRVTVRVIPTDEEVMIAQATHSLLS